MKPKKSRLTRKQISLYKMQSAKNDPASLGASFVSSNTSIIEAFNWYAANTEIKTLRKYIDAYVKKAYNPKSKNIEIFSRCSDSDLTITMGAIAKMTLAGCVLQKQQIEYLNKKIADIIVKYKPQETVITATPVLSSNNFVIADTEDMLDKFYNSDYKSQPVDYFKYLNEKAVKPTEARSVVMYYEPLLEELENEDNNLTKKQKTNYVTFVKKILDDTVSYLSNSRKERKLRKPRKKKIKSADQLVSRVKFKTSEPSLKLTSVNPTNIIGAQSVWLYNVKYKRLTYIVSDSTLAVKGTTITGFNTKSSIVKTIRKPEVTLPLLINTSKVGMLKQFLALKTKAAAAKGRINSDTLILKVNK